MTERDKYLRKLKAFCELHNYQRIYNAVLALTLSTQWKYRYGRGVQVAQLIRDTPEQHRIILGHYFGLIYNVPDAPKKV